MKIPCPGCARTLAVPDHLGGRRIKCPRCQVIFEIPAATSVAAAPPPAPPSPAPPPRKREAHAPHRSAVSRDVTPPMRIPEQSCPQCGAELAGGAAECLRCGWHWDQADEDADVEARRARPAKRRRGRCYIFIDRDEVHVNQAVVKRMKKLIETEELNLQIMPEHEEPPEELGPNDIDIAGKVKHYDYGSQFMRYVLTFITLFGPGSCQLEVVARVETARGRKKRINAKARQHIGVFGGTGAGLMKQNVKVVANKIAGEAVRHITGYRFLNAHAYQCAYWSLGLGLASLLPCIGLLLGAIGLGLGVAAFATISSRDLPRGKGVALGGMISSICGILISVVILVLMILK